VWLGAVVGLALLVSATCASASASARCKDVVFIGARGSGEPSTKATRGMGTAVYYMAKRMGAAVRHHGEDMGTLPVTYRADPVGELVPSKWEAIAMAAAGPVEAVAFYYERHFKPYAESIDDGIAKTIADVQATNARCPGAELVLAGYSQGAMAVHQAELQLAAEGHLTALGSIGGTLLLGDGDRVSGSAARLFGNASRDGTGIRGLLLGLLFDDDVEEPLTTAEICAADDLVCDFSLHSIYHGVLAWFKHSAQVHTSYLSDPAQRHYLDRAVGWLAGEMGLRG
jgi:hypothetical protein